MEIDSKLEFRQIPFVRLLIPFIFGIGFMYNFHDSFRVLNTVILSGLILLILLQYIRGFNNFPGSIAGILVFTVLFWCGLLSSHINNQHILLPKEKTKYYGIIYTQPVVKGKFSAIDCKLTEYINHRKSNHTKEIVRLFYKPDTTISNLKIGDTLIFKAKMNRFKTRGNPDEFDFANFMALQGILYMAFLSSEDMHAGGDSKRYPIRRFAAFIQHTVIDRFEKYSIKGDELAVISALVMGSTERLDREIRGIYTSSGAMHILAVSGWHIGLLFLFLNLILGNRDNRLYFRLFRMVVVLSVMWLYAFVTGLSPSVIRSVVMFSLYIMGKSFSRQTNNYNILAASALIILIFDPNEIFTVSFQLSYLAVLGILFFQPRLIKRVSFQNKIADNFWQLFTVSFAAQFMTLPACLYYFHQFPNYFWLTNILIIPIVWVVMIITVLFFCALPYIPAAKLISFFLGLTLRAMNFLIDAVTKLPYSVIGNIRFELFHVGLFSILLFVMIVLVYSRRKKYILPATGIAFLIFLLFEVINYKVYEKKKEIIIYNNEKGIAISLISGHKQLLIADTVLLGDYTTFRRSACNYWRGRQIEQSIKIINLNELKPGTIISGKDFALRQAKDKIFIDFSRKHLCLLKTKNRNEGNFERINGSSITDYLIIYGMPVYPENSLVQELKTGMIVITDEVSSSLRKAWTGFALKNEISIYDIRQSGALHVTD